MTREHPTTTPSSREIHADEEVVKVIEDVFREHSVDYYIGKTWTSDAIFRETEELVERRRSEECSTVEMEASALISVSDFREIKFGQILAFGDDVSGEEWDERKESKSHNNEDKVFELAVESVIAL